MFTLQSSIQHYTKQLAYAIMKKKKKDTNGLENEQENAKVLLFIDMIVCTENPKE